jgi:putative phosphonate metabolism protein
MSVETGTDSDYGLLDTRYAIFFVPRPSSRLKHFADAWIGRNPDRDERVPQPVVEGITPERLHEITAFPRHYGFHATLKAPFLLKAGATEADLIESFDRFVATPRTIPAIAPVVRAIGSFIAVVPDTPVAALTQLADDCVTEFERFRAPLSDHDRQRRLKSPLTPRQIEHLDRWGYPYVFEEFRFHMTLTGSLPAAQRETVLPFLQGAFAKLDVTSHSIGHIAIFRQANSDARFVVMRHAELRGK